MNFRSPAALLSSIEPIEFDTPPERGDALEAWSSRATDRAEAALLQAGFDQVTMIPLDISDIAHFNGPTGQLVAQAMLVLGTTGRNRVEAIALVHYTDGGALRITNRNA